MASAGHSLAQQRPNVEARIKALINNDLKEICKGYGAAVSGTKVILQKRCIQVLDSLVSTGNAAGFEEFKHRVANHGLPPSQAQGSYTNGATPHRNGTMAPGPRAFTGGQSLSRMSFKSSPFYDEVETIVGPVDLPGGPEMPQNRHTVKADIRLSDDMARRLKDDNSMRLIVYCGVNAGLAAYSPIDVAFPNQIEVKVNNDDVKHNYKGLKNTAGSTKPADITDQIRKLQSYPNTISICYALTQKRFSFVIRLVRRQSPDNLAQRIRTARIIPKQQVIDEMSRANADPDLAATSFKMSLKCPVSTMRITMPVRSSICQHNQCFDGRFFMELQEQAPTWSCPVCSKTVSFESLCVDKYVEEILNTTSKNIEQVTIEPNGAWSVEDDDEDKGKGNEARNEPRAAWDQDSDDEDEKDDNEVIDLSDSPKAPTNGVKHEFNTASPSMAPPGFSFNTPPVSSREASVARSNISGQRPPKRAASAVIDLTLDDEDEQPPRPAKRQATGTPLFDGTYRPYSAGQSMPFAPFYPRQQSQGYAPQPPYPGQQQQQQSPNPHWKGPGDYGDYGSSRREGS